MKTIVKSVSGRSTGEELPGAWLDDEGLLPDIDLLADIPGILITGRLDFQSPVSNAWELDLVWARSELVIVDDAGHAASSPGIARELIRATDRFASL